MKTCFVCKKEVNPRGIAKHISGCAADLKLGQEDIRFKQICHEAGFDFVKSYVEDQYCVEKWSLLDFQTAHGIVPSQTLFLLKYFNIKKRTINEANAIPKKKDKYKQTCLERYGFNNVSQVEDVKKSKETTCLKRYGVENVWKGKEYHQKLADKMRELYGKGSVPNKNGNANCWGWNDASDEEKKERLNIRRNAFKKWFDNLTDDQKTASTAAARHALKGNKSGLEKRIAHMLSEMGIDYTHQYWLAHRSFDFRIQNTKLLLEINGDFWHANPQLYEANDLVHFPENDVTAQELWDKDAAKRMLAEKHGYDVLYLWESEIRKKSDAQVKEMLVDILHK